MRILFLSRWFPFPANNGSKLRIFNLLRGLSGPHTIDLISFYDPAEGQPETGGLRQFCRRVQVTPWREFDPAGAGALRGFLSAAPRSVVDTHSPVLAQTVHRALEAEKYDLLIASQIDMAPYAVEQEGVPVLLEEAELGVYAQRALQAGSLAGRARHGLTWWKYRCYLRGLFGKIAACTVVSEQERRLLLAAVPWVNRVAVIPNCIRLQDYEGIATQAEPDALIYTGSFRYDVNYEAMLWFVREVYPLVRAQYPQVKLVVTGDTDGKTLPAATNVTLTGALRDVRPGVAAARVVLAPLQTGGGTRLKILEAMALRTPVVSTSKGAEGLEIQPGVHLLVADSPRDFADAVLRLLREDALHRRLAEAGYELVRQKYNWESVLPGFLQLAEETARLKAPES